MNPTTEPPSFTIVIPCFNDGDVLARAAGSVLAQTHPSWHLVIVDDGSTDDSAQVAAELVKNGAGRVRYVHQPNAGVSAARNRGISLADTSHVVCIDADDELLPHALATFDAALRNHPTPWIIGAYELVRGSRHKVRRPSLPATRVSRFTRFLEKKFFVGNISNMCIETRLLASVGFDTRLRVSEDIAVFSILFAICDPVAIGETVTRTHRRVESLRTRSSYQELKSTEVVDVIFNHPLLPQALLKYRYVYEARLARSLARHAYEVGAYEDVVKWTDLAVHAKPLDFRNLKLLARRWFAARKRPAP